MVKTKTKKNGTGSDFRNPTQATGLGTAQAPHPNRKPQPNPGLQTTCVDIENIELNNYDKYKQVRQMNALNIYTK